MTEAKIRRTDMDVFTFPPPLLLSSRLKSLTGFHSMRLKKSISACYFFRIFFCQIPSVWVDSEPPLCLEVVPHAVVLETTRFPFLVNQILLKHLLSHTHCRLCPSSTGCPMKKSKKHLKLSKFFFLNIC